MAAPEDRITRSTVLTLVAMGLGVFILANDFSAINARCRRSSRTSTPT